MKTILTIALLLAGSALYSQKAEKLTLMVKTEINCDHCLKCSSCAENIENKLHELKGIKKIKVDPKANTISVTYVSGKTTPEEIKKAINNAGFEADGVPAPAEALANLDACCKKK